MRSKLTETYLARRGLTKGQWQRLRKVILKRDDRRCRVCGCHVPLFTRKAAVHHIDYDPSHNDPDNLVLLCNCCHRIVHSKLYKKVLPIIKNKWAYVHKWGSQLEVLRRRSKHWYKNDPQIHAYLFWRSLKQYNA